jgi:hypothetical protein
MRRKYGDGVGKEDKKSGPLRGQKVGLNQGQDASRQEWRGGSIEGPQRETPERQSGPEERRSAMRGRAGGTEIYTEGWADRADYR